MRTKMLALAAIVFVSLSSLLVLNVRARKAAQEAQAAKPAPKVLPSAVRALTVTLVEPVGQDAVNVHLRNDSGRPILGFVIAHDEEAVEERPSLERSYTVITYLRKLEPNPLQPGLVEQVTQSTNEPIRPAAVLYEDGTVEGDRRAGQLLLKNKKHYEDDLKGAVAALRVLKANAKTKEELGKALARFVRENEPVPQAASTPATESEVPVTSSTITPGTHPAAAALLGRLAQENAPDVAVDEFIRRAEKRLGKAQ